MGGFGGRPGLPQPVCLSAIFAWLFIYKISDYFIYKIDLVNCIIFASIFTCILLGTLTYTFWCWWHAETDGYDATKATHDGSKSNGTTKSYGTTESCWTTRCDIWCTFCLIIFLLLLCLPNVLWFNVGPFPGPPLRIPVSQHGPNIRAPRFPTPGIRPNIKVCNPSYVKLAGNLPDQSRVY
jgi:hypothetical protein